MASIPTNFSNPSDGRSDTPSPEQQAEQQARNDSRDPLGRWLPGVSGNPNRWPRGTSGNPQGRPKTSIRDACRLIVLDPDYRQALWERLKAGKADHIEGRIWDHAFGRPTEVVAHKGEGLKPIEMVFLKPLTDPLADDAPQVPRPLPALPTPTPDDEVGFSMEDFNDDRLG
jgi:hypothetical protein